MSISALTQTDDSQIRADVRVCGHGSNRLYLSSHRRSSASAGHRHGSQFRNRPLKHVQRAHIVLCSADRLPVQEVARRAGVSRPAVWRWQVSSRRPQRLRLPRALLSYSAPPPSRTACARDRSHGSGRGGFSRTSNVRDIAVEPQPAKPAIGHPSREIPHHNSISIKQLFFPHLKINGSSRQRLLMLFQIVVRGPPRVATTPPTTTTVVAAMIPYSIAVTPLRSFRRLSSAFSVQTNILSI